MGKDKGQFYGPGGIAIDKAGNTYVVDSYNQRVQKFKKDGEFLTMWGSKGGLKRQFSYPYGIALDSSGNVYVADKWNNKVQKFTSGGAFVKAWGNRPVTWTDESTLLREGLFDTPAGIEITLLRDGFFNGPAGIAIDNRNMVYVVDSGNSRIQKFDRNGNFVTKWGTFGNGNGEFVKPTGITVDNDGLVYVTDTNNKRVQVFDSDGHFVKSWSVEGYRGIGLASPGSITVDYLKNVYVADLSTGRIQKFDNDGNLLTEWGIQGNKDDYSLRESLRIGGIAVDQVGNIYVSDTQNHRIQKFGATISYMPDFQVLANIINLKLDSMSRGPSGEITLMPASVHGAIVTSGNRENVFGPFISVGERPSIPPGHTAKIVAVTIQNKSQRSEHSIWMQLGYQDSKRNFVVGQELKVLLQRNGLGGDSVVMRLPEPFFVPADQLPTKGTDLLVRIAADGQDVRVEISLSVIIYP